MLRNRLERIWLPVILLIVGSTAALFRLPAETWSTTWAEDGTLFLTDAYKLNPQTIFEPYSGYLHLVPRIVAALSAWLVPIEAVSTVITVVAACITGGVAVAVFLFARQRLRSRAVVLALWLQVVLLPVAGGEVNGSIANSHWYLVFGAVWAGVVTPRSRRLQAVQALVVALAILSDPTTLVVLFPLVVMRVLTISQGVGNLVTYVYLGAGLIQGVGTIFGTIVSNGRHLSGHPPTLVGFLEIYSSRVGLGSIVGVKGTYLIEPIFGTPLLIAVLALVAVVVIAVAVTDPARRYLILWFSAMSVLVALLSLTVVWGAIQQAGPLGLQTGGRYIVVPTLLLFSAFCVAVDSVAMRIASVKLSWIPGVALFALVLSIGISNYHVWNNRAGIEPWSESLRDGRQKCTEVSQLQTISIQGAPAGFDTHIPCGVLLGGNDK